MSTAPDNQSRHEEILNSLDGIHRAKAPAFFYSRLRARMENELENAGGGGVLGRLLSRPGLSLSIAAVVLLLNATAILQMWKKDNTNAPDINSQQLVMADYSLDTYPVYDETPVEP